MDRGSTQRESQKTTGEERVRKNHLERIVGLSRREWLEAQARANAEEQTDPTPIEVPPFYTRPPTLKEDLQRYVRYEVNRAAHDSGFESFEEADDFDSIEEDDDLDDWDSQYQLTPMQEEETMTYDDNESGAEDDSDRQRESAGDRRGGEDAEAGASPASGDGGELAGRVERHSQSVSESPMGVDSDR